VIAKRSYVFGPLSPIQAQYHFDTAAHLRGQNPVGRTGVAIGNAFRNHWIVAVFLVGMGILFQFGG
jgi:hypothetical protein